MNQDIKEIWIAALTSGKYAQTREKLKSEDGFCCLGVLCDLHAHQTDTQWDYMSGHSLNTKVPVMEYHYFNHLDTLPREVMEWAGLEDGNPTIVIGEGDPTDHLSSAWESNLAAENDGGRSFVSIAHLIETQL